VSLSYLPNTERSREKCLNHGAGNLSDA